MEKIDFMGKLCPYCRCEFVPDDDIIVCSDCYMPHHRDCWVENQGCTTFGCQGTISSIDSSASTETSETILFEDSPTIQSTTIYCSKCGAPCDSSFAYCTKCGNRLIAPQSLTETYPPVSNTIPQNQQKPFNVNEQEFALDEDIVPLIGPKTEYYVPKFKSLMQGNKKTSWNWCAFLFGPYWMIYRKIYTYGVATLLIFFVLALIGGSILAFAGYIACGVLGNYLYLMSLEKRSLQANMMKDAYKEQYIVKNAGVSTAAAVISVLGYLLIAVLVI
jgi:hypothetical protein